MDEGVATGLVLSLGWMKEDMACEGQCVFFEYKEVKEFFNPDQREWSSLLQDS